MDAMGLKTCRGNFLLEKTKNVRFLDIKVDCGRKVWIKVMLITGFLRNWVI